VALGLHMWECGAPPAAWRAFHAELDNLYVVDSTLFGVWAAYFGFPTWITYALLAVTRSDAPIGRSRFHEYKTRTQPFADDASESGAPRERLLLVSQDVTDLRESEERLLLAAHALERMTEAIRSIALSPKSPAMQPPDFYGEVYAEVHREGYWSGTQWRRKNGSVHREWRSIRSVRDLRGNTTHSAMVFYEVGTRNSALQISSATQLRA
jgi:hypothetical protein